MQLRWGNSMAKNDIKIKNIIDLREHALATISRLDSGEIDCQQAGVTGKLYESVISSIKTQLVYAQMTDSEPRIKFLDGCTTVNAKSVKLISKQ